MADKSGGQTLDVISVGDIVTDAFIKLIDDQSKLFKDGDNEWLAVPYGAKIPFDHVDLVEAVGNASNASVCFARLGLKSALCTNVGDDDHGRSMVKVLQSAKVDTRFVRVNAGKKSNYHFVLWYKDDRTILIKHEDYDYVWPKIAPKELPKWIYFSSVGANALDFHDDLADWLEENSQVKMAFQPGTFQLEAGIDRLKRVYNNSELLAVNKEEAEKITALNTDDINKLFDKLHELGPKIIVISDGPDGSYASDGNERYKMPIYPDPAPPYDRTGAGDAFTSTFVAAVIEGNTIEGALQWAPINAMSVVQKVGAQAGLLTERELAQYLQNAPKWYKPTKL